MKLKYKILAITLLVLSLSSCSSALFARESYTITKAQIGSLSANLATLKDLTVQLRLKLNNYKQGLLTTSQELKQSEAKLELAESESNIFILRLSNQQNLLTEQSKSLTTAKKSLKQLRRRDKAKDILFMILIGAAVANGMR